MSFYIYLYFLYKKFFITIYHFKYLHRFVAILLIFLFVFFFNKKFAFNLIFFWNCISANVIHNLFLSKYFSCFCNQQTLSRSNFILVLFSIRIGDTLYKHLAPLPQCVYIFIMLIGAMVWKYLLFKTENNLVIVISLETLLTYILINGSDYFASIRCIIHEFMKMNLLNKNYISDQGSRPLIFFYSGMNVLYGSFQDLLNNFT